MDTPDPARDLERFRGLVLADRALQGRLRAAAGWEPFLALAVRLGAEHGCRFTAATVEAALRRQRQAWLERWI
jgi:hypothetical protein